jgi:PAS domain S-box-containing protein
VSDGSPDTSFVVHPLVQQGLLYEAWDQAPALVFVADENMRYIAVNRTACETLGYTRDELLGLSVTDIAVAPDAPELYDEMVQSHELTGVTLLCAKDGTLRPFRYAAKEGTISGLPYYISVGFIADPIG